MYFQPYDPKRSCWVPIKEGGFVEGTIDSTEGDKVTVTIGKDEKKVLKKDQVQQVNPPKFERCEDMSNLTYLNEASVLHNLKARYVSKLIYVSSRDGVIILQTYFSFVCFLADLLWPVLRGRQSLQEVPHLHRDMHQDVHQQAKERSISAHLCHCRWSLSKHAHP